MIETISACQRHISTVLSAQEVEAKIQNIVRQAAQNKPMDGFRTGSPQHLKFLRKQFQNHSEICNLHLQDLLKKEKLHPITQPKLTTVEQKSDGSLHYSAYFEVNPTITEIHWGDQVVLENLDIQFSPEDTVTETDVEQLIATMRPVIEHNNQENSAAPVTLPDKTQLYQELQAGIERNVRAAQKSHLEKQVIETLLAQNPLPEIPESSVEYHYQLLQANSTSTDDESALREKARHTVKKALLIEAYRKQHNIELNRAKLNTRMEALNEAMTQEVKAGKLSSNDVHRMLKNKDFMYNLFHEVLQEQVIEHLIQSAQSQPKPITYSKALGLDHSLKEAFTKEIQKFVDMQKTITTEEVAS